VDWSRITVFHLDEYIGIPGSSSGQFQALPQGTDP
jgi:6-phosphogluconolactonase/glucosamine-6-phosphate isomerase/deaminase